MDYASTYNHDFFHAADGMAEWKARRLKCGDALAAIAYAFGFEGLEALRAVVPFEGVGRSVVTDANELAARNDKVDVVEQLSRVMKGRKRLPAGFLEIGGGRGEVSAALAYLGYWVQSIEPGSGAEEWLRETCEHFFGHTSHHEHLRLINTPVHLALDKIDWSIVDTVLMVESLEHILAEDFAPVYEKIRESLRACGGRFIVTNWVDYHPINVGDYASPIVHCRLVDDALYDAWASDAKHVVYRNGSHLVLDY